MKTLEKLALDGGPKSIAEPLPGWPRFNEDTMRAVAEVLRSGKVNYWTGPLGMEFEQRFAEWCGVKHGISTSNGTSALHTALAGLGIGPGDEVIVPSYTFIATAFSVLQAGAVPVFADVDRRTHTLDPADAERKISPQTRAILPVHLYGNAADMPALCALAKRRGLFVVEDCAQAHGATLDGKKVGTFGDAGAFSFCQSKTFTTGGEGGAVVTDHEELAWRCRSFRDHGYDVRERLRLLELEAKLPYIHERVGFNYRMTEMQSAIGLKEMDRLDTWNLPRRRRNGTILIEALRGRPQILELPVHEPPKTENGFFVFPIVLDLDAVRPGLDAGDFVKALTAEGAPVGPVFWPQSYKERAFTEQHGFGKLRYPFRDPAARPEAVNYREAYCPNAAWLEKRTFITRVHPMLEPDHMQRIGGAIGKVCEAYAR